MSTMTATLRTDRWRLTDASRDHLGRCGLSLAELWRLLNDSSDRYPGRDPDTEWVYGYGIKALIHGHEVIAVDLAGANADNREDLVAQRVHSREAERAAREAADLVWTSDDTGTREVKQWAPRQRKPRVNRNGPVQVRYIPGYEPKPAEPVVTQESVLARVNPRLHQFVDDQVDDGDWSRVVVHSPNRVEVLPRQR